MSPVQHCVTEALELLGQNSDDWAAKVRVAVGYLEVLAAGPAPPTAAETRSLLESLAAKLKSVELAIDALPVHLQFLSFARIQSTSDQPKGLALKQICASVREGALELADSVDVRPSGPKLDFLHLEAARIARELLSEARPTVPPTKYRDGPYIRLAACLVQAALRLDSPPNVDRACGRVLEEKGWERTA